MSRFFNRDLSWLSFNGRVLEEAGHAGVPLLERIKFLGIYSSNLDEFYRVRMPVLKALQKISEKDTNDINFDEQTQILTTVTGTISNQLSRYGAILRGELLPLLKQNNIHFVYNEELPDGLRAPATEYFLANVLAYLQPVKIADQSTFFPENNKLYFIIAVNDDAGKEEHYVLNIPSDQLPRFFKVRLNDEQVICFLDDVIRFNLDKLFIGKKVESCSSFKITRDAELDLKDDYADKMSEQIERQLTRRDYGLATRFLFEAGMPLRIIEMLRMQFGLQKATAVQGGRYHNLKDLGGFPVSDATLSYPAQSAIEPGGVTLDVPLAELISKKDLIVHTPFNAYGTVLRFFNEAANNPAVEEISVTLYRVASDSKIANALITAARNGKKVQVLVELKARFDEANNLKWSKRMRDAGVKIIYSVAALKVHAKVALVKTRHGDRVKYNGLLATGNFNESTARFYTDHVLLTANAALLREVELLFIFLARREKPSEENNLQFNHLLVAQFNLQSRFLQMIDREIGLAKAAKSASIQIKLNNLEERVLIEKLYEASQAGVKIELIVRSICCLIPGVPGMSENITIKRIVDRYLEHGRIFIFNNDGNKEVYLGSADWMNRNIYHRIEVCFPVTDSGIKQQMIDLMQLQLADNKQAVCLDAELNNIPIKQEGPLVSSQYEIYQYLNHINEY